MPWCNPSATRQPALSDFFDDRFAHLLERLAGALDVAQRALVGADLGGAAGVCGGVQAAERLHVLIDALVEAPHHGRAMGRRRAATLEARARARQAEERSPGLARFARVGAIEHG